MNVFRLTELEYKAKTDDIETLRSALNECITELRNSQMRENSYAADYLNASWSPFYDRKEL